MSTTAFHRTVCALALTLFAAAHSAHAASVTLNNWTFGSGGTVNTATPNYNGAAGGFSGSLDGAAVMTYCVELTQQFNWNVNYTNFTDMTGLSYFGVGSDKALQLAKLVSYAFYDSVVRVNDAAQSTSLQLAVWNVVYDQDITLATGAFTDTSGYASYATSLLSASQNFSNLADVWVLASATQQDQLRWSRVPTGRTSNADGTVPEPGALALVLVALGAAGLASRRRG